MGSSSNSKHQILVCNYCKKKGADQA